MHVRKGGQHVAFDFALVGSSQDTEAAVFAPPGAPRVDGDLRIERRMIKGAPLVMLPGGLVRMKFADSCLLTLHALFSVTH